MEQLVKIIEKQAPQAWALLRSEFITATQVKVWLAFGSAAILCVIAIVAYLAGKRMNERYPHSSVGDALYLHSVLSAICFIVLVCVGCMLCVRLVSPNLSLLEVLLSAISR